LNREGRILANLGLVRHLVAIRYPDLIHTSHFEDLVQSGTIGLIKAVDAYYSPTAGIATKFSTYARVCIISELQECESTSLTTLLPARDRRERSSIRRRWAKLERELGREPTTAEFRASWPTRAHKLGDKVIERALDEQPKIYFGHDPSDSSFPQLGVDGRIEQTLDAKRELDALELIEPIDARLRRAV